LTAILTATLIFGQQNFIEQIGQIFGCSLRVTGALMAIYTAGVHVAAVADQQL
jgi:disulfide bond formation protein DsbB